MWFLGVSPITVGTDVIPLDQFLQMLKASRVWPGEHGDALVVRHVAHLPQYLLQTALVVVISVWTNASYSP